MFNLSSPWNEADICQLKQVVNVEVTVWSISRILGNASSEVTWFTPRSSPTVLDDPISRALSVCGKLSITDDGNCVVEKRLSIWADWVAWTCWAAKSNTTIVVSKAITVDVHSTTKRLERNNLLQSAHWNINICTVIQVGDSLNWWELLACSLSILVL